MRLELVQLPKDGGRLKEILLSPEDVALLGDEIHEQGHYSAWQTQPTFQS